ncbi:MAG: xanthine dehydrogenase [Clostridia bacterium]|nr:xanthine dehydrogenase [Clostridia bacterium]
MIPFDFDYYKPSAILDAVNLFYKLKAENKTPVYYGGGTEIISRARVGNIRFDSVIDIKNIAECACLNIENERINIGSAVELNKITESNVFPLLADTVKRIADHTVQCKITLGGNILGNIKYKEGILPLMLADAKVSILDQTGRKELNINEFFNKKPMIEEGQLLEKFSIDKKLADSPWYHCKEVKMEKIDYPLITVAAIRYRRGLRLAVSGLLEYPFRSAEIESIINNNQFDLDRDFNNIINALQGAVIKDKSSDKYRLFVLKKLLKAILREI